MDTLKSTFCHLQLMKHIQQTWAQHLSNSLDANDHIISTKKKLINMIGLQIQTENVE